MDHDEMFDEPLEQEWESPAFQESELRKVQRSLRQRNTKIVLISVLTAAALLIVTVFGIIPAAETAFWDPGKNTYDLEMANDLELAMIAYSELFSPSQTVNYVNYKRTGFGTYSLSVCMYENFDPSINIYHAAALQRGELKFPQGFWYYTSANIFSRASYPIYTMTESTQEYNRNKLEALPDYIRVRAAVSFPEDLTMEELMSFAGSLEDGYIEWVGIRNSPEDRQCYPLCGMKPYMGGYIYDEINEFYPEFDIKSGDFTAEAMETHFKSLLRFSQDQVSAGTGIDAGHTMYDEYYSGVLEYVEENGVMTYGCYLVCDAQQLLELLDSGIVSQVWPEDAWIDI